jgi:hypothetical protein
MTRAKDLPVQAEFSSRKGRVSMDNITQRDSKRPSERPRDKEYHRRFSGTFPNPLIRNDSVFGYEPSTPPVPLGGHSWPNEHSLSPSGRAVVQVNFHDNSRPIQPSTSARHTQPGLPSSQGNRGHGAYFISLIHAGDTVQVLVWPTMSIAELMNDAGSIFGLDLADISLLLFTPVFQFPLRRDSTISVPPLVAPDSSVMVFHHQRPPIDPVPLSFRPFTPQYHGAVDHGNYTHTLPPAAPSLVSSKLLATFKLPKFDGVSKNRKTWDRAFQRFLGMHQLDHVLEHAGSKRGQQIRVFSTGGRCSKWITGVEVYPTSNKMERSRGIHPSSRWVCFLGTAIRHYLVTRAESDPTEER